MLCLRPHTELPVGEEVSLVLAIPERLYVQVLMASTYRVHPQMYFGFAVQSTHPGKRMIIQIIQR